MILWWMLACTDAPTGPWTREAALAPQLARMDLDRDGRIIGPEYEHVRYAGAFFPAVDTDHDGFFSVAELDTLTTGQDPVTFFLGLTRMQEGPQGRGGMQGGMQGGPPGMGRPGGGAPGGFQGPSGPGAGPSAGPGASIQAGAAPSAGPPGHAAVWTALMLLREEVLARDPGASVPSSEEIAAVEAAGGFDTPAAHAALTTLETASTRLGLGFPASLRATAP
ncbi:MAG: hypothetical protein Q8P41_22880 [Pseudomonadota bacterium]|nr:hypothetical protein [Pseudomonadota bacterium]